MSLLQNKSSHFGLCLIRTETCGQQNQWQKPSCYRAATIPSFQTRSTRCNQMHIAIVNHHENLIHHTFIVTRTWTIVMEHRSDDNSSNYHKSLCKYAIVIHLLFTSHS
ncbi:hypothetical protein V8G54_020245 [Vigna mungo]|uniref:Uncharacterized protein n=1 Tax=Vigna mungo TaxID=3915 RepID=A0AAQ3NBI2_VIGMU